MKVEILQPSGYCKGVKNAFSIAEKARMDYPNKTIYLFGPLVHNKNAMDRLINDNFSILKPDVDELEKLDDGSVIVLPAHGHTKEIDQIASEKNLIIYDAICPFIQENIKQIKKQIKNGNKILFYGDKNHIEVKSIISLSSAIYLLDKEILKNYYLNTKNKYYFFCQSTIKNADIYDVLTQIKDLNLDIDTQFLKVCNTTNERQKLLYDLEKSVDAVIIVGDKTSNNSNELFDIALKLHGDKTVLFIKDSSELDTELLRNKKHIVILSGASTPDKDVLDVFNNLNY